MTDAILDTKKRGRGRPRVDSIQLSVRVQSDLLAAVDAWIGEQAERIPPEALSRPEAIRRLAAEALISMGLLKP